MPDEVHKPDDDATLQPPREADRADEATLKKSPEAEDTQDVTLQKPTAADPGPTGAAQHDQTLERPVHAMETLVAGKTPPPAAPPESTRTFGDYVILETIARGGMGIVYKARQRKLNRLVALKMILAGQFADQTDVDRFYSEAEAAAGLRHSNIVAIHEVGHCDGQHYFSMDYIEGQSLAAMVRDNPLPPRVAAQYVKTIAEAMHYAHQQGILHRDLKPSNVLLDRTNEPLITDFGLAKHAEGQSQLTMSGTIIGTPSYMPPEQASGRLEQITVRSDVYSIGAILYELLTGRPPFRAANPFETIKQVLENEPVAPRMLNPSVPVDLETICLECLQKEPQRRYGSAQQLADELRRFLAHEPIQARPVGPGERFVRWCRRNPRVATLAGLAILFFLAALVGTSTGLIRTRAALHKAEISRNQLLSAINRLFTLMSEEQLLQEPGLQEFREKLLTEAKNLYQETSQQLGNDPRIQHELGLSHFRLARIMLMLNAPDDALGPLQSSLEIQQSLHARSPGDVERLAALADSLNLMGQVLEKSDQLDRALAVYEQAVENRSQLVVLDADNTEFRRQLINSQMNSGLIRKALGDRAPPEEARDQYERALRRIGEAQSGRQQLLARFPSDDKLRLDLAMGYYNLADLAIRLDQLIESREHLDKAIQNFDRLLASNPGNLDNQYRRALCLLLDGDVKGYLEDPFGLFDQNADGQLSADEVPKSLWERLARADANRDDAVTYEELFAADSAGVQEPTSRERYQEAQQALEKLAAENAAVHKYRAALASVHMRIGESHFMAAEDARALVAFEQAVRILEPLVAEFPLAEYQYLLEEAHARVEEIQQMPLETQVE